MIRFLQISDIHFSDQSGGDDEYAQMKCKFLEDIKACHEAMKKIDYVLICGDIAFSGMDSQYKEARKFIKEICENAACDKDNVFMVPGNHDKKRDVYSRTRSMMKDQLLKGKNTKTLLESKVKEPMAVGILYAPFKQYYKLAAEHVNISDIALKAAAFPESDQEKGGISKFEPGDAMYWAEQLGEMKGFHVAIHGSNTSLLSDKDDGESWNMKEGKHLQILPLQAYNVTAGNNEIHILMLHHPMSEIQDGNRIGKDIDSRFKLQFYGHIHKQSSSADGAVKIYSGALIPNEAEENIEYFPVYNVIEMDVVEEGGTPSLKVEIYSRKWDGVEFVEYTEETKTGENALKVELPRNDSWKITMEKIKRSKPISIETEREAPLSPHAIKHAFLNSDHTGKIIKQMYGEKFDGISQSQIRNLTFLKQVEVDKRFEELHELSAKYGK